MNKYFVLILSALTFNVSFAQSIKKNDDIKYVDFVESFKGGEKSGIIDFRRTIQIKAPMSKDDALKYVYHTGDTTKLYCIEFNYSNENEEFIGIIGSELYLPDKCLKIDMGDYFFIAYNSYQCANSCPDPDKLRECFENENFNVFLTLCIVDKGYNIRDSMLVCNDDGYDSFVKGLLNPSKGKVFLIKNENRKEIAHFYIVGRDLKFKVVKEREIDENISTDNLIGLLEKLGWKESFLN
jgi:hypothetical protein